MTWGLLELEGDKLRIAVQAPLLADRKEFSRPFVAALLRRSSEIDQAQVDKLVSAKVSEIRARDVERNESAIKSRTRALAGKLERVEKIEKAAGISFTDWHASPAMGLAIKAMMSAGVLETWGGLEQIERQLRSHADRLKADIDAFKATAVLPDLERQE